MVESKEEGKFLYDLVKATPSVSNRWSRKPFARPVSPVPRSPSARGYTAFQDAVAVSDSSQNSYMNKRLNKQTIALRHEKMINNGKLIFNSLDQSQRASTGPMRRDGVRFQRLVNVACPSVIWRAWSAFRS